MNGLSLSQLIGILYAEDSSKPLAIFLVVGIVIAGAAQMAGAAFTISYATLQSTGSCLFSEQLQESESVRQQYIAKLAEALGGMVSTSNSLEIDTLSADCLSCHDGVMAPSISAVLINNPTDGSYLPGSDHRMIGMDHPIGMDYNRYVAASMGYKPLFGISDKMVFVNGRVGCLTCHDPLNPEKGHLVINDRNCALCYTCHDN